MTGILAITISLMAGSRPCFAIDTPSEGYKLTNVTKRIQLSAGCWDASGNSLFTPTKTDQEWSGFRNWLTNNANQATLVVCATCSDGIQNQGETGIDCGGPCATCAAAPTCSDGIQNQGETGIDCGGPCAACSGSGDSDSSSNGCNAQGIQNACGTAEGVDNYGNPCSFSYDNCNAGLECCGSGCCPITVVATPPAPEPTDKPQPPTDEPPTLPPSPTGQPPTDEPPPADEPPPTDEPPPPADEPPTNDQTEEQLP